MKTTLQTKIKNNIGTIIILVFLTISSIYSNVQVSILTTELEDMKDGGSVYALKSDLEDLNERQEKLATAFYSLLDTHDSNVKIYNEAIEELRDWVSSIADIVKKLLNSNYY